MGNIAVLFNQVNLFLPAPERTFGRTPMLALDSTRKRTPGFDGKRLHLLKVAARVFSEVGYGSASMRRISAETELSLAGIYHYVASKEELLYWIQYRTFDSLLQDLNSSLEGIVEPKQRLATAVRNHVRHFGENMLSHFHFSCFFYFLWLFSFMLFIYSGQRLNSLIIIKFGSF